MGLDMYLSKKTCVKNWAYRKPEEIHQVIVKKNGKEVDTIDSSKISYIEEEVAYWRKANQIHNWFVENVQEGRDDCEEYWTTQEDLENLVNICKKVLSIAKLEDGKIHMSTMYSGNEVTQQYDDGKVISNIEEVMELLPTSSGFFYGSTEYNEYYLKDLEDTIEMLEPYLDEKYSSCDFYYSASW